jgi:hypothetical protein
MDPDLVAFEMGKGLAIFQTPWICPMNRVLYIKQQRACSKREPLQFPTANTVLTITKRVGKL